jgi:hypothetical protein
MYFALQKHRLKRNLDRRNKYRDSHDLGPDRRGLLDFQRETRERDRDREEQERWLMMKLGSLERRNRSALGHSYDLVAMRAAADQAIRTENEAALLFSQHSRN